jgi:hypothetical protein
MAKNNKSSAPSVKISFGQRRKGKAQKTYGPKDSRPKKYRGQGK